MTDVTYAFLMAFLPLTVLTFGIAYYSYRNGIVSIHDEKDEWGMDDTDWDDGMSGDTSESEKKPTNNYLHSKWLSFGGGFYGLMALLTFTVIEARELGAFIASLEGFDSLVALISVDTLVSFIKNSIFNMVDAFVWFFYWPKYIAMGNGWVWLGMAYGGYNLGRWGAEWVLDQ